MRDSMTQINRCLTCRREECDNCIDSTKQGKDEITFNGEALTIKELAKMRGYSIKTMKQRISRGGLDYAMSDYREYKSYLRATKKRGGSK